MAASKSAARDRDCTPTSTCPAPATTSPRIWGTHTLKAGVFWEHIRNAQPANNTTQGALQRQQRQLQHDGQSVCRYAARAISMRTRRPIFNRVNDISYDTYEGFVQDSWKVNRRLDPRTRAFASLTSLRGRTTWASASRSSITPSTTRSCTPTQYCGFLWNKRDPVRPARRLPDPGRLLSAALRRGLRARQTRPCCAAAGAVTTITPASSRRA